jgi:hypothetical protein
MLVEKFACGFFTQWLAIAAVIAARRSGSGSRSETFTRRRASESSPKANIQRGYF